MHVRRRQKSRVTLTVEHHLPCGSSTWEKESQQNMAIVYARVSVTLALLVALPHPSQDVIPTVFERDFSSELWKEPTNQAHQMFVQCLKQCSVSGCRLVEYTCGHIEYIIRGNPVNTKCFGM